MNATETESIHESWAEDAHGLRMVQARAKNAAEEAAALRQRVVDCGPGGDWQWDLDTAVRRDAEARIMARAVESGVDPAAKLAMTMVSDGLGLGGSTDRYEEAQKRSKAAAAKLALESLTAVGLTYERLGELFAGKR